MCEYAPTVYKALNGAFCIYKPAGQSMKQIAQGLKTRLSTELNSLRVRPPKRRVVYHEENLDTDLPVVTTVPDLADHELVVGPRYLNDDFHLSWAGKLAKHSSGVMVLGLGPAGQYFTKHLAQSHQLRAYHLKGELGKATRQFSDHSKIVEKTTYYHISQGKIDKVLAGIQAGHQRHMFHAAEVHPQSQEAYELAVKGLLRPKARASGPMVYNIKCIEFDPPHFTLELHAVSEDCEYLRQVIHELGLEMKSSAVCTQTRRIRYGEFSLSHSLLLKHWTTENIIKNIALCKPLCNRIDDVHDGLLQDIVEEQEQYLQPVLDRYSDGLDELDEYVIDKVDFTLDNEDINNIESEIT